MAACVVLYFLGILLIQSIMLVGYIAMLPTILVWEKYSGGKSDSVFDDGRLREKKSEIKKLQGRIDRSQNESEKKILRSKWKTLENELRRLEWSIRESNLTRSHDPANDEGHPSLGDPMFSKSPKSKSESDRSTTNEPRERRIDIANLEKREHLLKILGDVKQVLTKESQQSVRVELLYLANEVRAHYNIIRKKDPSLNSLLSDYWVVWVVLYSLSNNSPLPDNLERYSSSSFRSKFIAFTKFINAQRVSIS